MLLTTGAGHVVVVYWFAEVGPDAVQVAVGTFVVLLLPQVVVVQLLPEVGAIGEHEATPVGPVGTLVQLVAVQLLPEDAAAAVQVWTGTLLVTTGAGQLVVV